MARDTKGNRPAKAAQQASPTTTEPQYKSATCAAGGSLPFCSRLTDVILCGIYAAYAVVAVHQLYTWCRDGLTPPETFGKQVAGYFKMGCEQAKLTDLSTANKLHKAWRTDVFSAKDDATLRAMFIVANVLALPLALVTLFGAKGNCWQKPALVHATVMLVLALHTVMENCTGANSTLVFKCAAALVIGAPVALLNRWWKDNAFETSSQCRGCYRMVSFVMHLVGIVGLAYCLIILGEWAAVKTGHEVTLLSPTLHTYTDEAFLQAKTQLGGAFATVSEKLDELMKSK
ncbi:hypothetical protein DIPPA_02932 [Diplonema papillatum]|nr:hypothetical protein DIPPA_02932 [Diplonema papillatum]|eukprot:gene14344-22007_t